MALLCDRIDDLKEQLSERETNLNVMREDFIHQLEFLRNRAAVSSDEAGRLSERMEFSKSRLVALVQMAHRLSDDFHSLKAVLKSNGSIPGDAEYRMQLLEDDLRHVLLEMKNLGEITLDALGNAN